MVLLPVLCRPGEFYRVGVVSRLAFRRHEAPLRGEAERVDPAVERDVIEAGGVGAEEREDASNVAEVFLRPALAKPGELSHDDIFGRRTSMRTTSSGGT